MKTIVLSDFSVESSMLNKFKIVCIVHILVLPEATPLIKSSFHSLQLFVETKCVKWKVFLGIGP